MSATMAAVTLVLKSFLRDMPNTVLFTVCVTFGGLVYIGLVWSLRRLQFMELAQLMFPKRTAA